MKHASIHRSFIAFSAERDGPAVLCSCSLKAVGNWTEMFQGPLKALPSNAFRSSVLLANDPERDNESSSDLRSRLYRAFWRLVFPQVIRPPVAPGRAGLLEVPFARSVCHRCNGGLVPRLPHTPGVRNAKWNQGREYIMLILLENGYALEQPLGMGGRLVEGANPELRGLDSIEIDTWVDARLKEQFPAAPWWTINQGESALYDLVVQCVPDLAIERNPRHDWMNRLELDIHIPALGIAFEYNGEQHYRPVTFFGGEQQFRRQQELDAERRRLCEANGVRLIEVRYDEVLTLEKVRDWIHRPPNPPSMSSDD